MSPTLRDTQKELDSTHKAMRRAQAEGCVSHLDTCDDGGAFWHDALARSEAANSSPGIRPCRLPGELRGRPNSSA